MDVEKKSVKRLYLASIKLLWREKLQILRLLSPILVLGLLWIALPLTSIGIVLVVLIYCVGLYSFLTCSVQMHQNVILDQDFHDSKIFPKIQKVHFQYLGLLILFRFISILLDKTAEFESSDPFSAVVVPVAGIVVGLYLTRFYFILPATAVGSGLNYILEITSGRLLRFWGAGLLLIITLIPINTVIIVGAASVMTLTGDQFLGFTLICLVLGMLVPFNVFISVVYRQFAAEHEHIKSQNEPK